jgi:uncharacterized membrane protein YozB (DUF420 family)
MATITLTTARRARGTSFYPVMATVVAGLAFAGFARTYFLAPWFAAPPLSPLVHLHGALFTAWIVLFGIQVWLVQSGKVRLHRRLGLAGAVLALLMVIVGYVTAITSARLGHTPSPALPALAFLAIPLSGVVAFATLVGWAVARRRDGGAHKRLMLLATIAILSAAVARLPFDFIADGGPPVFYGLTDLLVVAGVLADLLIIGRIPGVWFLGGGLLLALQIGSLLAASSAGWIAIAAWLVG